MRFIVGSGVHGSGVYLLKDGQAKNLTAIDGRVGKDLRAIIEGTVDLDALVAGVDEDNPDRYPYVMDHVDVPAVINYLAATVISCDYDHETHNYFM